MEKIKDIQIIQVPINKLKPSEYNPRHIFTCYHCGKEFIKKTNLKSKRHFCSRKCWSNYCVENLKDWINPQKIAERNKNKRFRKKVSEGLKQYYKKHRLNLLQGKRTDWRVGTWKGIRKAILEKYNCQCIRCKKKEKLNIHHIIPERANGKNEIRNLIPLCRNCHQFIEKNQLGIFNIVKNWEITAILMRDSFLINN